mgnify:CR=1 FL=1
MKAFQELTDWDADFTVPNHVYFLNDSKEKMYGYVDSKGIVQTVQTPYRFFSKGRKFKEVPNKWNFVVKEEEVVESTGKEYRVPGSRGGLRRRPPAVASPILRRLLQPDPNTFVPGEGRTDWACN